MASRSRFFTKSSTGLVFATGKEKIEVNYEILQKIVKSFQREGDDIAKLHEVTKAKVEALKRDWMGRGSEAFISEMENCVLPSLERLYQALIETALTTNKISKKFRSAEEAASAEITKTE
jgi:WXG100 family type VII secretion target